MSTRDHWLLALMLVAAVGCDDSNANPEPDDTNIATSRGSRASSDDSGGKGGSSAGAAAKSDASSGKSGSAGTKSTVTSNSSGDDAGTTVPSSQTSADDCKAGTDGCFCGAPTKDADFINQCTAAMCSPFDNTKLKKRNADGSLPPIP